MKDRKDVTNAKKLKFGKNWDTLWGKIYLFLKPKHSAEIRSIEKMDKIKKKQIYMFSPKLIINIRN